MKSYRILAAPQSPVGTNFGDVPAETILPYCARAPFRIPVRLCTQISQPSRPSPASERPSGRAEELRRSECQRPTDCLTSSPAHSGSSEAQRVFVPSPGKKLVTQICYCHFSILTACGSSHPSLLLRSSMPGSRRDMWQPRNLGFRSRARCWCILSRRSPSRRPRHGRMSVTPISRFGLSRG